VCVEIDDVCARDLRCIGAVDFDSLQEKHLQ
jgi:hypothetical protein